MFINDLSGMEFQQSVLALFVLLAGVVLALFLAILFARKHPRQPGDLAATCCMGSICLWHLFAAAILFGNAAGTLENPSAIELGLPAAFQCLALFFAVMMSLRWAAYHWAWGLPLFAVYLVGVAGLALFPLASFSMLALALLALLAAANLVRGRALYAPGAHAALAGFGLAGLGAVSSGVLLGLETVTVAALACLALLAVWKQALGLVADRRVITVMALATVSVAYLIAVTIAANDVSLAGGLGDLMRLAMLCAAGLFWLPMYAAMARLLTRRTEKCMRAIRRVLAGAERVLDLDGRCEYFCVRLRLELGLRRCLLVLETPRQMVAQDPPASSGTSMGASIPDLRSAAAIAREQKIEVIGPRIWRALRARSFSCALPLWANQALLGFLLLETGRALTFDDLRPLLPVLAQELSQSISACTLVEEKLALERALVRREHLAGLGQLAATVAHEVKNPLSSIHAIAQLMSEDAAVMETHGRDVGFIASETARLAANVQQLLAYARPASARSMVETPVYEVLEVLTSTLKREQAQQGIEVLACLEEQLRLWKAPGDLLREVMLNLLLNAVEFSSSGMVVDVSALLLGPGECEIAVTDMGPGVPPESREKIFEPFFSTRQRGAGLGLATVRKNLTEVGGTVELTSPIADGQGSCFRVRLPVVAVEVQPCGASA